MKYGYVGRSNLITSKICLGTMHFGAATDEKEAFAIMDRAMELGINFFDTANVYNGGKTEEIIGKWLAQGGGRRENLVLATKCYGAMDRTGKPNEEPGVSVIKIRKHLEDSLRRLQTDYVDLYQVHHIDTHVSLDEFWQTMQGTINSGKALYLGSSNFPGWGLGKYQTDAKHRGLVGFIAEQSPYSLICRFIELEVAPAAKDLGIGILAYMPLAGGILSGKKQAAEGSRTSFVTKEYEYSLEMNQSLETFSKMCAELGEKEHVVATAWTLHNPVVASTLVGARTLKHLDDVERIVNLRLPQDFLDKLDEIFTYSNGRPLRPTAPAPNAYAGITAKETRFIEYY